jgi:phage host-nuclease inhibitor protein Gam
MLNKITYIASALIMSTAWALPAVALGDMKTSTENKQTQIQKKIDDIEAKSAEKIKELQAKAEKKTDEVRKKACEARQTSMQNRLSDRVSNAEKHKLKFDSIYTRIKDFASSKSISSSDITALSVAADASSSKVSDEIAALKGMNVTLDCTKPDEVASIINSYKTQLVSVKAALKEYREAVRAYAQSVKSQAETIEGGQL